METTRGGLVHFTGTTQKSVRVPGTSRFVNFFIFVLFYTPPYWKDGHSQAKDTQAHIKCGMAKLQAFGAALR